MKEGLIYQISNKNLEYIVALAQQKTISAAAESVFISQPAMSHFIHNLEEKLGFKLFNRVGNQYIPTYEGERCIFHARRIMALEAQMFNELVEIKKEGKGQIRFVLPTLRSAYILPHLVSSYHRLHPNVELIVQETHSRFLEKILVDGEVDFAIMNIAPKNPEVVSEFICHDEVLLAVPKHHPLARMGKRQANSRFDLIDIGLFRDEPFVLQKTDQRTRRTSDQILKKHELTPSVLLETRSIEAALGIVANGSAVCFIPETYVYQENWENQIHFFSLGEPEALHSISIAYLKNTYRPKYYQDFIEEVKNAVILKNTAIRESLSTDEC